MDFMGEAISFFKILLNKALVLLSEPILEIYDVNGIDFIDMSTIIFLNLVLYFSAVVFVFFLLRIEISFKGKVFSIRKILRNAFVGLKHKISLKRKKNREKQKKVEAKPEQKDKGPDINVKELTAQEVMSILENELAVVIEYKDLFNPSVTDVNGRIKKLMENKKREIVRMRKKLPKLQDYPKEFVETLREGEIVTRRNYYTCLCLEEFLEIRELNKKYYIAGLVKPTSPLYAKMWDLGMFEKDPEGLPAHLQVLYALLGFSKVYRVIRDFGGSKAIRVPLLYISKIARLQAGRSLMMRLMSDGNNPLIANTKERFQINFNIRDVDLDTFVDDFMRTKEERENGPSKNIYNFANIRRIAEERKWKNAKIGKNTVYYDLDTKELPADLKEQIIFLNKAYDDPSVFYTFVMDYVEDVGGNIRRIEAYDGRTSQLVGYYEGDKWQFFTDGRIDGAKEKKYAEIVKNSEMQVLRAEQEEREEAKGIEREIRKQKAIDDYRKGQYKQGEEGDTPQSQELGEGEKIPQKEEKNNGGVKTNRAFVNSTVDNILNYTDNDTQAPKTASKNNQDSQKAEKTPKGETQQNSVESKEVKQVVEKEAVQSHNTEAKQEEKKTEAKQEEKKTEVKQEEKKNIDQKNVQRASQESRQEDKTPKQEVGKEAGQKGEEGQNPEKDADKTKSKKNEAGQVFSDDIDGFDFKMSSKMEDFINNPDAMKKCLNNFKNSVVKQQGVK